MFKIYFELYKTVPASFHNCTLPLLFLLAFYITRFEISGLSIWPFSLLF